MIELLFVFKVCSNVMEIIIIIEKTDAGLNGLCIRDINVLYDFINIYNKY